MTGDQTKMLTSVIVLGNAVEVVTKTIIGISGNDISNRFNGDLITENKVRELAVARMVSNINKNQP